MTSPVVGTVVIAARMSCPRELIAATVNLGSWQSRCRIIGEQVLKLFSRFDRTHTSAKPTVRASVACYKFR